MRPHIFLLAFGVLAHGSWLDSASWSNSVPGEEKLEKRQSATGTTWWYPNMKRQGTVAYKDGSPFSLPAGTNYVLWRNVKDYGAKGDGVTDDTAAFNNAIADAVGDPSTYVAGNSSVRCGDGCHSSSVTPVTLYVPPGTYMIDAAIKMYYNTAIIGDVINMPTIKGLSTFYGIALLDADPYGDNGFNWYANQNNFYRQIRNLVLDITLVSPGKGACLHWQVAQATMLQNVVFNMVEGGPDNQQYGIFMENASGGFMSDLVFNGGNIGAFLGSQQFTSRNMTFNNCNTAIYLNWDWVWLMKSITINNCKIGIDISSGGGQIQVMGSLIVQDSVFRNTDQAIVTTFDNGTTPVSAGSLIVDNVDFTDANLAISYPNRTVILPGGTIVQSFLQGRYYSAFDYASQVGSLTCYVPAANSGRIQQLSPPPPKPSVLLTPSGTIFERSKPQYADVPISSVISMKDRGAKGDGVTDDSDIIQSIFNSATIDQLIYFDHGAYVVTKTIQVPTYIRITGEMWPLIMAQGSAPAFSDINNPQPMFRVGNLGDVGHVEMTDLLFETIGPAPGAILVEWNLAGDVPGNSAMWDVHWKIGGTIGTNLQSDKCTKTPTVLTRVNPQCIGAFMLMHVTSTASILMENNWGWVADHEIDRPDENQINIYVGRGLLVESTKPTWIYGTSFEHAMLYNYQVANAQNVYMGIIQSETAYMQNNPNALVPFTPMKKYSDPDFSSCFQPICYKTWGLRIYNSTYVLNYGAGLYSFFNNYDPGCMLGEACQENMVSVELSEGIYLYALTTKASQNLVAVDSVALVPESPNDAGFCETVVVFEYP